MNNTFDNMTTVYHVEYGKGYIVGSTPQGRSLVYMCFFPKAGQHDWVNSRNLETDTDDLMSLKPIPQDAKPTDNGDPLAQALENLFSGGR